ncbi:MAG TPA: sigma-70 family RNA polymerase sigma factor [Thermoanaerobaculia bacterium]|nr:sigma-70 family RNA polymerase sigma factor [Thermoanaerobaculia bacterium]
MAAGDAAALAKLYDRHAAAVLGLLLRMLRNRGEAEEVLQEAWLQAWRQAAGFRAERSTARGWVAMIARSRALDRLRSVRAARRREDDAVREGWLGGEESQPMAHRELEERERRSLVDGALAALPAEQRQCLELAFFDGLSHSQIAERLGAPLGTVKSRILMGMGKLRTALAPYRG